MSLDLNEALNASLPSKTCSVAQACDADRHLLFNVSGINTVAECKELCVVNMKCNFISYFGPESSTLRNHCMLFSSCETLHNCSDCFSEDKRCFNSCDTKVEAGEIDNALKIITDVPDEPTCLLHCQENAACRFFTYYTSQNLSYLCVLQSELSLPMRSCQHCRTGVPDCRNSTGGLCTFSIGADTRLVTSHMFNKWGNTKVNIFTLGNCELTVVAVGGGGEAGFVGGGAGYLEEVVCV